MVIVGLGSGFSGLGSPLLITELAHPAERGKITALYKYVDKNILTRLENSQTNIMKAPNITLVLSSEAVSDVLSFDRCSNHDLTAMRRDYFRHSLYQLELVLEVAEFAASSTVTCPGLPGLPPPRISSLARVARQK